jgi:hypothetical protein
MSASSAWVVPGLGRLSALGSRLGIPTGKPVQPSPWLDVKAAGAYVGFCEKTVRRACATGGLRHVRRGRRIRTQRVWLDEWMLAHDN